MTSDQLKNITFVLFGASGDLSKRYLLPALKNLGINAIPISRKDYPNLSKIIPKNGKLVFHLAIPPDGVPDAVRIISENFASEDKENIKILLEKPFGKDLKSAESLIQYINQYFDEDQIYRVDHYLVKRTLSNLIDKNENNNKNIKSVKIIASEKLGIEGRVNFYEQTGALRDFVQSHMLEMAAVTLAGSFDREKRQEILKSLAIVCDITKNECVKRGQYEGYRKEVGNPKSMTETFVSVNLAMNGIGITLTTGKALNEKFTQIKIVYKDASKKIFNIEQEPDAYERVLFSAINGDHNLFTSSKEVIESWRILEDIQNSWKNHEDEITIYKQGSSYEEI